MISVTNLYMYIKKYMEAPDSDLFDSFLLVAAVAVRAESVLCNVKLVTGTHFLLTKALYCFNIDRCDQV